MVQGVHVSFVGRIAVKHPRPNASLSGFCLHHGKSDVPEAHSAHFFGHVWQPQPSLNRLMAKVDEVLDVGGPHLGLHLVAMAIWLHRGLNDIVHKVADLLAHGFVFWCKCEIDHLASPLLTLSSLILMPRDQRQRVKLQ